MILTRFLRDQVTVIRFGPGAKDRQGKRIRTKLGEETYPAQLQQQSSQELSADRNTLIDIWTIFLPPDAQITAGDQVRHGTRLFQVDGSPQLHQGIRDASHITARLRYVAEVS